MGRVKALDPKKLRFEDDDGEDVSPEIAIRNLAYTIVAHTITEFKRAPESSQIWEFLESDDFAEYCFLARINSDVIVHACTKIRNLHDGAQCPFPIIQKAGPYAVASSYVRGLACAGPSRPQTEAI